MYKRTYHPEHKGAGDKEKRKNKKKDMYTLEEKKTSSFGLQKNVGKKRRGDGRKQKHEKELPF